MVPRSLSSVLLRFQYGRRAMRTRGNGTANVTDIEEIEHISFIICYDWGIIADEKLFDEWSPNNCGPATALAISTQSTPGQSKVPLNLLRHSDLVRQAFTSTILHHPPKQATDPKSRLNRICWIGMQH
ncbi:hypothetical protein PG984_015427 [Apiospora sp. TS-2023a]